MKRRDFIINSALVLGATTIFGGCTSENAINTVSKNTSIIPDNALQVARRKFKNLSIPLLGFGCMRFPTKGDEIDLPELEKMVDYAMACGVNFFDTAHFYMQGRSETTMGEMLKKYDRSSYFLSTKNPIKLLESKNDVLKIFDGQLKKCQTDYFDFYMAHNINKDTIENYKKFDVYKQLLPKKQEGKIKNLGFSFHGDVDMLKEIVKERDWDFCMLQLNYYDWDVSRVGEMYEIATKANIPIMVMEPLRGGGLCALTPAAQTLLEKHCPNETPTSYALRWLASKENVFTILSGMSKFEHVKENIDTLSTSYKPLTSDQEALSKKLVELIRAQGEVDCTVCKYCIDTCPRGVNIPEIFAMYNTYKIFRNSHLLTRAYEGLKKSERIDRCIDCGACISHCPKGLNIPKILRQVQNEL